MKPILVLLVALSAVLHAASQNVGIGTITPAQKLDVNGSIKSNGLFLPALSTPYDFLTIQNSSGEVGVKKGFGAQAINYIICMQGIYPSQDFDNGSPWLAEIRLFAGTFAPRGWAFCHGQALPINQNQALFSLLGTSYGGNGVTTFALPDLRGVAPVSAGSNPAGYQWILGQKAN